MESVLLNYFVFNDELCSTCDFNSSILSDGPGIYEVIRVIEGKPLFLDEHLNRFFQSAKHEHFTIGYNLKRLKEKIRLLIEKNKMSFGSIRFQFIVHPNLGKLFIAWAISIKYPTKNDQEEGVRIISVNAIRKNPHSKRTNLPVRFLAEKLIMEKNVYEVLMVSQDGLITEGSRSNIFFVRKNDLITPEADLVLQGVTRDKIIKIAGTNNISVIEENIRIDQFDGFDACFLSSTTKSVLPVRQINDHHFKIDDPLMRLMVLLYNRLIKDYLHEFKW